MKGHGSIITRWPPMPYATLFDTLIQSTDFAQGYDNGAELVLAVFVAVSFFALISWLTKRRH
jgi:hypothetical protein